MSPDIDTDTSPSLIYRGCVDTIAEAPHNRIGPLTTDSCDPPRLIGTLSKISVYDSIDPQ